MEQESVAKSTSRRHGPAYPATLPRHRAGSRVMTTKSEMAHSRELTLMPMGFEPGQHQAACVQANGSGVKRRTRARP
jgi:hypothetical protein